MFGELIAPLFTFATMKGNRMDFEKERNEALIAGKEALSSLKEARELLSSARNWGIYDTLFKGGFISGLIKHSKMDNAEQCIIKAKDDLSSFNAELHDLDLMGINLNTGDLLGFADIFFDGFLSDILMQSRIKDACEQVDFAISKVQTIINQLENL